MIAVDVIGGNLEAALQRYMRMCKRDNMQSVYFIPRHFIKPQQRRELFRIHSVAKIRRLQTEAKTVFVKEQAALRIKEKQLLREAQARQKAAQLIKA